MGALVELGLGDFSHLCLQGLAWLQLSCSFLRPLRPLETCRWPPRSAIQTQSATGGFADGHPLDIHGFRWNPEASYDAGVEACAPPSPSLSISAFSGAGPAMPSSSSCRSGPVVRQCHGLEFGVEAAIVPAICSVMFLMTVLNEGRRSHIPSLN